MTPPGRRPIPKARAMVGLLLVGAASGLAVGLASAFDAAYPIVIGIAVVAMALAGALTVVWWRAADEAVREAHKWAWYWGGSAGLAVGMILMLTVHHAGLEALVGDDPREAFVMGMMSLALCQLAGYALAWAGWWLARR